MSKPLLLLHGAIGSSAQLLPLKAEFEKYYPEVFVFDFPGHGGKDFPDGKFSIQLFADSVLKFLLKKNKYPVDIFGYSMGGYVALYLATNYPEIVGKIFTLGTKLEWFEDIAEEQVKMINPETILQKVPKFAEVLEKRHAPLDWKLVLKKTAEMMIDLGNNPALCDEDFEMIENEVLLTLGGNDEMVTSEETIQVHAMLPNGKFKVFDNMPHPIEKADVRKIAEEGKAFFG